MLIIENKSLKGKQINNSLTTNPWPVYILFCPDHVGRNTVASVALPLDKSITNKQILFDFKTITIKVCWEFFTE